MKIKTWTYFYNKDTQKYEDDIYWFMIKTYDQIFKTYMG